ncbi:MAG: YibE/F family protein [Bacillota bacterium]
MKKRIVLLILLMVLAVSLLSSYSYANETEGFTEKAVVLEADEITSSEITDGLESYEQYVKLKITSGKYKGETFEVLNNLSNNPVYDIPVKSGDKVVVYMEETEAGDVNVFISDYMRDRYIIYLYLLFVVLIILIGRTKGLKAVISLTVTMFTIIKIMLPLFLKGMNPIALTVGASIFVTIFTLLVIAGINSKSAAAIIGTTSGVMIAGLLAYFVGSSVRLTGMSNEEAVMLLYIPQGITFDFKGLLFSGIIMGALGAVMDIGMSIASAVEEIYKANPCLTRRELFTSGMNVGRDVMGTMTNTLILAYTGSSIPLLLLFMAYETSMVKILNLDIIATEAVRSLTGSIGLVLTIPITAAVASTLIKRKKQCMTDEN